MSALHVHAVRAFADNYIWLIESPLQRGVVVAVDPGEAPPVLAELAKTGLRLGGILLTHHHYDHIDGVPGLLAAGAVPVIGPDDARVPHLTQRAREGEPVEFPQLGLTFETLHIPGHTLSHIAYWGHGAVFSGDTLFSAGCGRMFEGTPQQMNHSLNRLRALPAETAVYCGHEYTAANVRFALTVEPDNLETLAYQSVVQANLSSDKPSLPSKLDTEVQVNPFLRCDVAAVRQAAETRAGKRLPLPADVFAVLRAWKDGFR